MVSSMPVQGRIPLYIHRYGLIGLYQRGIRITAEVTLGVEIDVSQHATEVDIDMEIPRHQDQIYRHQCMTTC